VRALAASDLDRLFDALAGAGYRIIGPTVRDGAIVYDELHSKADLPIGWTEEQTPGSYRLKRRSDEAVFGHRVGPDTWKRRLFAPREPLFRLTRRPDGRFGASYAPEPSDRPDAFLGLRACDVAAIARQDRIFLHSARREPRYAARRERSLLVAVHCTEAGDLCFCDSMGTGPRVEVSPEEASAPAADITLAELGDRFLIDAHTDRGRDLLQKLPTFDADEADAQTLDDGIERARAQMGRTLDADGLPERLFARLSHPRFQEVAERCLACGNCTNVCPTCFCSTTEEHTDLRGDSVVRERLWDSCFTEGHGEIHGANVRPKTEDRYRQWLSHKLASWVSQFGHSGCTGCGRCIAWCPVGIDLTEEANAIVGGQAEAATEAPALPLAPTAAEAPDEESQVPRPARVIKVARETQDVATLHLATEGSAAWQPGQYHMLSVPGVGEAAISISGEEGEAYEHTVHAVGALTSRLTALAPGSEIGIRGPYGHPWPLDGVAGRPVVVVAGGIGLAPLRGAIRHMLARPREFPDVRLLYGTRTPETALFATEMLGWTGTPHFRLQVTVDHASPSWRGRVGVVTRLLRPELLPAGAAYLVCGPEVMMRFTVRALDAASVPASDVYVSMERHMKCAVGFCGRCQLGPWFTCKDGPVLRYDQVKGLAL
jgi:NAD(P)H-flavin reductase/NAD-dependent dihydropyrimidine dehydrogenase PreA subunit